MSKRLWIASIFLLLAFAFSSTNLFAQLTADASLVGVVKDSTGAVVAGASVKLESAGTGATRETSTNGAGEYRFELVPAGTYKVTISMAGFQTHVMDRVVLAVGQTTTNNATLAVGQQTQTVTVEGSTPLVNTEQTDVGTAVTPQEVKTCP